MQTVGTLLRERRLEKGISVQRISQETMVAQKYLYALENSQHDVFPAISYLVGYLRVYAEYLGFNGDDIILRFRNEVLQEQPVPIEELLVPTKKTWKLVTVLIVAGILVIGGLGYLSYTNYDSILAFFERSEAGGQEQVYADILNGERIIEQPFSQKTALQVEIEQQVFQFIVAIQEDTVVLTHQETEIPLSQSSVRLIDFNEDGDYELSAFVRSINAADKTAIIRFSRSVGPDALTIPQLGHATLDDVNTTHFQIEGEIIKSIKLASFVQRLASIAARLQMQAPSYVRLDSEEIRLEELIETGEQVSFSFQERAYVSLTNGAAVELVVDERRHQLEEGSNSFVLHWVFDDTALSYSLMQSYIR